VVAVLVLDTSASWRTLEPDSYRVTAREVQSSSLDGSPIMNYH